MGDISSIAGNNNNEQYAYAHLTASGVIKASAGQLGGFIVASGTPTVALYDNATQSSSLVILNTMQVQAATPYPVPVGFNNGCFAFIVGTADITFFYRQIMLNKPKLMDWRSGGPVIGFNFLAGTLPSSITFTGAANSTFYNSSGLITANSTNTPRFDYNPTTLALNGMLIENAATNLVLQSQFSASWGNTSGTFVAANVTGPDGTTSAGTYTENTANAQHNIFTSSGITVTANTNYTASCFMKKGTRTTTGLVWSTAGQASGVRVNIDLNAGTVSAGTALGTGNVAATGIQSLPNGWYRVWITGKLDAASTSGFVTLEGQSPAGTTTYVGTSSTFFVYGAQLELDVYNKWTSYIPTTTTSLTRSADTAKVTSIPWYNANAGSMVAKYILQGQTSASNNGGISFNSGSNANFIELLASYFTADWQVIRTASAETSRLFTNTIPANGALVKLGGSWSTTSANGSQNGSSLGVNVAFSNIPTTVINELDLGKSQLSNAFLNGWIQSFSYWNYQLSQAQLNTLTT